MEHVDRLVIGGGAAGMAAALAAAKTGKSVMLCEKEDRLGGLLNQCLHRGFGRAVLEKDLTGPEYAAAFIEQIGLSPVQVRTGTCVLAIDPDRTALISGRDGLSRVGFDRCILAAGCREQPAGSLKIAGTRPAGVFTAGTAQYLENVEGRLVGRRIVILGSGDIGQIMARQFVQSGREVVAMLEITDRVGGLARNRRECLEAYQIPVLLRATVEEILGSGRIRGVKVRHLDTGLTGDIACDTLITAVGLLPEQSLCRDLRTDGDLPEWLRLCGNCESIHDIVDSVTREAEEIGARF